MELYVGGKAQGKLSYVKKQHAGESFCVVEGPQAPDESDLQTQKKVLWHGFHLWVLEEMERQVELEQELMELVKRMPDLIVISDEVGNGIVPLSHEERDYRETVGRLLCRLAEKADRMERIICGFGQKIK